MVYYLISNATDKKEVGHYIQTTGNEFPNPDGTYDKGSRSNLSDDKLPDFVPQLDFELENKAKITDIISASNITSKGFLMNEKVKTIFRSLNLCEHQFFNATVLAKTKKLDYFWLHLVNGSYEGIDFEKSSFFIANSIGFKEEDTDINSLEEFTKKSQHDYIRVEKLIFVQNHPVNNLDLFFFPQIHTNIIASERLISKLLKEKITGFKYKEADFC